MRPVGAQFETSQDFGSMKTAGVAPNRDPASGVSYYVWLYGNYQPFGHAGEDIACEVGTPVYAMAAGTVLWADWGTNLPGDNSEAGWRSRWYLYKGFPGKVLVVQHNGWIGVYAHLSEFAVKRRDTLREGQLVAKSGDTGGVAPHLHIEALVDLNYTTAGDKIYGRVNPARFYGGISPQGTITESEEDELDPNAPIFVSKDGAKVSLNTFLNSLDLKLEGVEDLVDGFPKFDDQVREAFDGVSALDRDLRAELRQSKARQIASDATLATLVQLVAAGPVALTTEQVLAQLKESTDKALAAWLEGFEPALQKKED